MAIVYIGIGSNLQEPITQVENAILNLNSLPNTKLIAKSSLYYSTPQGPQDQPNFINAVAKINTNLQPLVLLNKLQQQELQQGKKKLKHWGARIIDLDILLFDQQKITSKQLVLPHPQMHLRDFVLLPLAEIAPYLSINKEPIAHIIKNLTQTYVTLISK